MPGTLALAAMLALAADDKPVVPPEPEYECRFDDGSVVMLTLGESAVVTRTKFGELTVPLAEVKKIQMGFRYPPGVEAKVRQAVEDLGSRDFSTREAGHKTLVGVGEYAVPHMIEGGGGSVIMTSSMAGIKGFTGFTHYVAAKHGVIGITRALANETAKLGIRVNAICPTAVNTDMMNNQWAYSLFAGGDPNATRKQMLEGTAGLNAQPVALIEPQDLSRMVLFLACDESRFITGLAHPVDAGSYNKFP